MSGLKGMSDWELEGESEWEVFWAPNRIHIQNQSPFKKCNECLRLFRKEEEMISPMDMTTHFCPECFFEENEVLAAEINDD